MTQSILVIKANFPYPLGSALTSLQGNPETKALSHEPSRDVSFAAAEREPRLLPPACPETRPRAASPPPPPPHTKSRLHPKRTPPTSRQTGRCGEVAEKEPGDAAPGRPGDRSRRCPLTARAASGRNKKSRGGRGWGGCGPTTGSVLAPAPSPQGRRQPREPLAQTFAPGRGRREGRGDHRRQGVAVDASSCAETPLH